MSMPIIAILLTFCYAVLIYVTDNRHEARLQQLIRERSADSICTFARSFDRRTVDPWVIRAVWEEVREHVGRTKDGRLLALRADDDINALIPYDEWELEDVFETAARRANRSFDDFRQNPYFDKIECLGDYVLLLNAQPPVIGARSK